MFFRTISAACVRLAIAASLASGVASCASGPPPEITPAERAALADPSPEVRSEVAARLPALRAETDRVEAEALARGRALTAAEGRIARALGVAHPERVRVHTLGYGPGDLVGIVSGRGVTGGVTTGYGISVKRGMEADWLIAHELVHVAQFERLGRAVMLTRLLTEQAVLPGNLIPLEREAIAASEALVGPGGVYAY